MISMLEMSTGRLQMRLMLRGDASRREERALRCRWGEGGGAQIIDSRKSEPNLHLSRVSVRLFLIKFRDLF